MRKLIFTLCFVSLFSNLFAQQVLKVGQTLPNIALLSTKGTVYDFNAQKNGKGFIVVFMTPTCDHCIMYENRVMALDKKYKTKGFPVVAIGPYGDNPIKYPLDAMPEMKKVAIKKGFTFPYLTDDNFRYTTLLGIKQTPTAVVLQKNAKGYLIKYIGRIDDEMDTKKVAKNKFVEQTVNKML
ncbi:redoxin family protein [Pedobacter cryotolerans]|uniref:Redoxin domain-containing protein n=1 Tax=Pedobacter cryotolerans TaxID=2571270 RepID=A0A4U1C9Q9_9SPHI|nr:redoxin family protein [Pedobacter cryotolerans]TKC02515.1 redoxin domain-containing protein [Pedobacter cryotolerans]